MGALATTTKPIGSEFYMYSIQSTHNRKAKSKKKKKKGMFKSFFYIKHALVSTTQILKKIRFIIGKISIFSYDI